MKRIEELLGAKTGEVVAVVPRYVLITNGFGHEITELASHVKNPDKALVVYDHNVPAGLPEESKIFQEILQYARKEKIPFYQAKGIAQKWMLEENMVAPTDIIITGTRHSSIFGSIGALGLGLSHTEMARVLETGEYQTVVPETVTVRVIGKLRRGIGIIDVALHFLDAAGDIKGKAVEFICPDLTAYEREVLCEMATDTGAFTAFAIEEGESDMTLDLSQVGPMLRLPCADLLSQTAAGVDRADILSGQKIHAVQLGGMNGGTLEALRTAAAFNGRKKTFAKGSVFPSVP